MKFTGCQSDAWHKKISDTVGQRKPTDADFPWIALQNHTGYYLKKKGKLSTDELDDCLLTLIKNHPSKEVAIAACANEMSLRTIRNLLVNDFRTNPNIALTSQEYLQVIIATNHVNTGAVSEVEVNWARYLMDYSAAGEPSRALAPWLKRVLALLPARPAPDLLLQDDISRLARTVCTSVATELEDLRHKSRWLEAEISIKWLSRASVTSESSQKQLLDSCLPE